MTVDATKSHMKIHITFLFKLILWELNDKFELPNFEYRRERYASDKENWYRSGI